MLGLILLVFGFVFFVLAALGVVSRFNLTAAGLACWILTEILTRGGPLLHF
jgi:hypothetical protein